MELGTVGVWLSAKVLPPDDDGRRDVATELEELGFGALWVGGSPAGDLALAATLLAATQRLVVGTSIVNIWTAGAGQVAAAHHRLTECFGPRFLLGLGAGHARNVEPTGQRYVRPLSRLRGYLDELDAHATPVPVRERVLAALGPKALALAAGRAAGAIPYLTTPEHTRRARRILGDGPLLAPEQKIVLERDPQRAREIGHRALHGYLALPNYVNAWRSLGFGDEDFADGGSDRLVDALVAHGSLDVALARVVEHLEAGADHVCIQPVDPDGALPREQWRLLATALPVDAQSGHARS